LILGRICDIQDWENPCDKCGSSDAYHHYGDGLGGFCFSCGFNILSDARKEELGIGKWEYNDEEVMTKEKITKEEIEKIKEYTGTSGQNFRGIPDETYKAYACRFKYSEETGEVIETLYPYTEGFEATGFKVRMVPKDFRSIGKIGKDSDLFGAWKWKSGGRTLVICCGELDALSAFTILEEYRKGKGNNFEPTAVVSSGIGEAGSYKQFQLQYDYLDQFQKIIYVPDNDAAGKAAVEKIALSMPKGKFFIANLPMKDVNEMLVAGKSKHFISAFFDAKPYTPTGVVGSSSMFDAIVDAANVEKMEFPPFMPEVNEMLAGGVALGTIGVISAFTGIAKSTIINESIYYWIFNSPHKIGIVSMEQSAAQLGELILSRHMQVKIGRMLPEQKREFLTKPSTIEAQAKLFRNDDGTDRFFLIDDRDMELSSIQAAVEKSVISCGCRVVVIDTVSDINDALTTEEQAQFMKWCKSLVAMYNCTLILIAHQRKPPAGTKDGSKGGMPTESGVQGSSTITKSATWVLMCARDKMNEDPEIRNTTFLELTKIVMHH